MSTVAKVFVVVILFFSSVFCVLSMMLFAKRAELRDKLLTTEKKLGDTEGEKKDLSVKYNAQGDELQAAKLDIDRLKKEKIEENAALTRERDEYKKSLDSLKLDYGKLSSDVAALQASHDQEKAKNKQLEDDRDHLNKQLAEARKTIDDQTKRIEAQEDQKTRLEAENLALNKELKETSDNLALKDKIINGWIALGLVPSEDITKTPVPPIDGKVLTVDNKSNIIVINIGKDDGVRVNYKFTVYRGEKYVGQVLIEGVEDAHLSHGRAIISLTEKPIAPGDNVSTRFL